MVKHLFIFAASLMLLATAAFAQVGTVDGVVVLPNQGGPAAGATVTIYRLHADSLTVTADSMGHFRFDSMAVGEWGLHAYLAPYLPATNVIHLRAGMTEHVTMMLRNPMTGFGRVAGMVLLPNFNGPAVGATVAIINAAHDTISAASDDSGRFVFESVPVGVYSVLATFTGCNPANARVHVMDGQTAFVTLILIAPPTGFGRVEGLVLLPNMGGPAVGATVVLFRARGDSMMTVSDDSGHFAFDSARIGVHDIHATLPGFERVNGEVRVIDGATVYINLVLRAPLTGTGRVVGTVVLPFHAGPAVGATVVLFRARGDSLTTLTGDSGEFVFDSAAIGVHDIYASLAGYNNAHAEVRVIDGQTVRIMLMLGTIPSGGGSVSGLVTMADGSMVPRALVRLNGRNCRLDFHAETDSLGHFGFRHVPAGPYMVTAMAPMHGMATAEIAVVDSQTTEVTLVLNDSSNGGGGHHGDTLTTVDLTGVAIVVIPDSIHHPRHIEYFIDVDYDGVADYRLGFGPPWYNPPNVPPQGAHRPANGDTIAISGGLLTYATPPVVVVYEINGLFWRRPFVGHGGHGGGDHHHNGCNPDSVTRVELEGTASVHAGPGFHGEQTVYALVENPGTISALLDFGRPDYTPGNGAVRPVDGEAITIVGGQVYCPDARIPVVIVYEINGMLWREPGDTLGLGPEIITSVDPIAVGAPLSYLTARNYPNPFNPITTIEYSVPTSGQVKLAVYDLEGREVAVLVSGTQNAGSYSVAWDGSKTASGIYFYRLTAGEQVFTSRMLLLK
jgi:hypothetical protein